MRTQSSLHAPSVLVSRTLPHPRNQQTGHVVNSTPPTIDSPSGHRTNATSVIQVVVGQEVNKDARGGGAYDV